MKPLKRVVIKQELVELTGDFKPAIILNQFIYWTERMFDTDAYIREEKKRASEEDISINIEESKGWIYKTSEELIDEVMMGMSVSTIRRYIKQLVEDGFIKERRNPKYKWDKTMQYRVDLYKVQTELGKLGYVLEGYKLLPGITIVSEEDEAEESNKKVVPTPIDTTDKETENNFDNNIISDNTESIPQEINVNEKSTYTEKEIRDIAYNNLKDSPLFEKYPEVTKALKIEAEVKKLKTRLELGLNI